MSILFDNWNDTMSCCLEAIITLRSVELGIMIVAAALSILLIVVEMTNRLIHRNLRYLLIEIHIVDLVLLIVRGIDLFDFSGVAIPDKTRYIKIFIWLFSSLSIGGLQIERVIALYSCHTYDISARKIPYLFYIELFFKVLLLILFGVVRLTQFNPGIEGSLFSLVTFFIVTTASLLFHLFFRRVSRTKEKQATQLRYTMQENRLLSRYQYLEVMRSTRMLNCYIPYQAVALLINISAMVVVIQLVAQYHPRQFLLSHSIFYTCFVCTRILIGNIIMLLCHPTLKRSALKCLNCRCLCCTKRVGAHNVIRSVTGEVLNFGEEEGHMYFEAYAKAWDSIPTSDAIQEVARSNSISFNALRSKEDSL